MRHGTPGASCRQRGASGAEDHQLRRVLAGGDCERRQPTVSANAFQYRCDWAKETRSHPATTVVIPQSCPHLQATLQQVGADMGKLQVL
jgi:hypothetical protein